MLSRLQAVIGECRAAYAAFDFRKVFQVLNQFCTVDLSAIYVDVTKDRMYCDAADAPRRRATQAVMAQVFDALCRLLAPVIAFTADEAWEHSGREGSVHEALFPEVDSARVDSVAEARVDRWMRLRALVAQGVETARQSKLIGNALEAAVSVETDDASLEEAFSSSPEEAEEFLILSQVRVVRGGEAKVVVDRNPDQKCQRCWRYRPSVGASTAHPGLCVRCEEVVA
jgi:isoleucyl-tRNA synthetase